MAISHILLPIDATEESQNLIRTCFPFARSFEAHVSVLYIKPDSKDIVPLLGEGMSVAMIEDMIDLAERQSNKRYEKAKQLFDEVVAKNDVNIVEAASNGGFSTHWILENGREDEVISRYSRLADIIFLSKPKESVDVSINLKIHTAIFESGRAVLIVPSSFSSQVGRRVIISWNGSVQSARAIRAALPILRVSEFVHIITVHHDRSEYARGGDLKDYLGWHGISAETHDIKGSPNVVGPKLLQEVKQLNGDLLVMGAYTHSRMRQLILGGVTRYVMEHTKQPVLMAH
ncbi:MAG: universal stress protein UspA [Magnetovibrio sp.]|nr:universal stress protein UspA [Magnetovibrio sp.]|tara:strand:- start:1293 stop:2156 length:864 start_codon:yes stop_codon:yes gene_type:complete